MGSPRRYALQQGVGEIDDAPGADPVLLVGRNVGGTRTTRTASSTPIPLRAATDRVGQNSHGSFATAGIKHDASRRGVAGRRYGRRGLRVDGSRSGQERNGHRRRDEDQDEDGGRDQKPHSHPTAGRADPEPWGNRPEPRGEAIARLSSASRSVEPAQLFLARYCS